MCLLTDGEQVAREAILTRRNVVYLTDVIRRQYEQAWKTRLTWEQAGYLVRRHFHRRRIQAWE